MQVKARQMLVESRILSSRTSRRIRMRSRKVIHVRGPFLFPETDQVGLQGKEKNGIDGT